MKHLFKLVIMAGFVFGCDNPGAEKETSSVQGTWRLVTGTLIENGDTTQTDYTEQLSMIKIINATHFAFLNHDLNKGKDSSAVFVAGGGSYMLQGNNYTENLEYCSAREWEGNTFHFQLTLQGDTLIQRGTEKIEDLGVDRINIEKYIRIKETSP